MIRIGLFGASALVFSAIVGCSSAEANKGSPPTISDLVLSSNEVAVGKATTLTGTFKFTDPDGDISEFSGEVKGDNGLTASLPKSSLLGASGQKAGTVGVQLSLQIPTAGNYAYAVWTLDAAGNQSNKLTGTIVAK